MVPKVLLLFDIMNKKRDENIKKVYINLKIPYLCILNMIKFRKHEKYFILHIYFNYRILL